MFAPWPIHDGMAGTNPTSELIVHFLGHDHTVKPVGLLVAPVEIEVARRAERHKVAVVIGHGLALDSFIIEEAVGMVYLGCRRDDPALHTNLTQR